MKKLLITSALAGSLLVSASAFAEMKVKGYVETTIGGGDTPATSNVVGDGTTIGYETGVTFSGSKDLENGMTMTTQATLEDSAIINQAVAFKMGASTLFVGNDYYGLDDKQTVPVVANTIEDGNKSLGVAYNNNAGTIHSKSGVGLMNKNDYGTFAIYYVPKVTGDGNTRDSKPSAVARTGSGTAIGYQGGFGIEGLALNASRTDKTTDSLDSKAITMTNFGAKYTFGAISVGAQTSTVDDATFAEAYSEGNESEYISVGATYALTDALSVGVQYGEAKQTTGAASEENTISATAGYNLGGQVISLQYTEVENAAGAHRVDGDALELRIKSAF